MPCKKSQTDLNDFEILFHFGTIRDGSIDTFSNMRIDKHQTQAIESLLKIK
jgi:hypothetical protein